MAIGSKNGVVIYKNIGLGNIAHHRLPWAGKMSTLCRASGALMFLLLPLMLYSFGQSLTSEIDFVKFAALLSNGFAKVIAPVFIWAYLHHFYADIRYLVLDLYIGVDKTLASKSTVSIPAVNLLPTVVFGAKLSGLF